MRQYTLSGQNIKKPLQQLVISFPMLRLGIMQINTRNFLIPQINFKKTVVTTVFFIVYENLLTPPK